MADLEKAEFFTKKWPQLVAASIACFGPLSLGTVLGWSSPAIPNLVESKDLGELDPEQCSWIASLAVLGALVSAIPAGLSIDRIGRRMTCILLCIPLTLGWLIIVCADSVRMLYTGRFVIGFSAGAFSLVVPVYIGEISSDKYRGQLGSLFTVQLVHGILFAYFKGSLTSWMWLSLISASIPVVFFIAMFFMPESPIHLISMGKMEEAAKAMKWLRGAKDIQQIQPELKWLQQNAEDTIAQQDVKMKDLLQRNILRPILLCVAIMILQQASGIGIAILYTVDIFKTSGSSISANLSTIIMGVAQVIGVSISSYFIDRAGRKILLSLSCCAMTICMISLGAVFYIKESNGGITPDSIAWVPLASLVAYIVVFSLGLGPIPWILMGELLPAHVRGTGAAIVTTFNWLTGFIVTKFFEDLSNVIGVYSCYWIFAGVCLTGAIFTYFVLPETKGKSSEEIQAYFSHNSSAPTRTRHTLDLN